MEYRGQEQKGEAEERVDGRSKIRTDFTEEDIEERELWWSKRSLGWRIPIEY